MQRKPYQAQEEKSAGQPLQLASCIASASHLTLQVAVFDRGKPAVPHVATPFLSIPSVELQAKGKVTETGSKKARQEFELNLSAVAVATAPPPI